MNYASITALMAVESSFIPFPSEVVIPPAAFVAGQPDSVLCATGNYLVDVTIIVLFGTLGAMIGAIINYGLSVWLGRIIIYKFADSKLGHLCLLSSEKLEKAEAYFREKGNVSTFIGRFIPGIRQLISIPAGLSRMHFGAFLWWTFLGAYMEIGDCYFAQVVSIRSKKAKSKKLDKSDQEFYRKHRDDIDLKRQMNKEEEELVRRWMGRG